MRFSYVISITHSWFLRLNLQILNVVLRFAWLQTVLDFEFKFLHTQTVLAVVACLEIIRRGIWNFFRLLLHTCLLVFFVDYQETLDIIIPFFSSFEFSLSWIFISFIFFCLLKRLENEHLNNVGKYRAFKSVPLPFSYDEDDEKDDWHVNRRTWTFDQKKKKNVNIFLYMKRSVCNKNYSLSNTNWWK